MEKFFQLKENGTSVATEVMAGLTTFFAMSYIIFVNPAILSLTGMPSQAVFLSTIIATVVGTLIMGLFANVPYAQAPGMGLNAFFTYTVVFALGFSWQEALAMVFLCGIINIIITVTKVRKMLIRSIPTSLQHAIGGGIGIFIAYIGIKNAGFLEFTTETNNIVAINNTPFDPSTSNFEGGISSIVTDGGIIPALVNFTNPVALLALLGLALTIILVIKKVKGAILIGIISTTLMGIPLGVTNLAALSNPANSLSSSISELGTTFGAAFGSEGFGSLLSTPSQYPLILMTIFAFSLTDIFDTVGTFIGTGRKTGIFSAEDEAALDNSTGIKTKMDKALFADAIATTTGAIFGTSNVTTYVESAAGIGMGGRTGLTSVVTAGMFMLTALFSPIVSVVPTAATAPALILVGIMMLSSFTEINWDDLEEAIPAFFASVFMGLAYSISYGIAAGFISYIIVKSVKGKAKKVHPVVWVTASLFIINFAILALI
ncbi:NCS2 family permease [Lacticigenium naphthae]|uniref:NCS2 family permease n=1 Tax=Lacticigenium naphthae TaxID=515351 RepID=UPI000404E844|nr:NCS2 family permease [Lacticigenium naphthae]